MPQSQSYSGIYPVHKERGETLATLLERFRRERDLGPEIKLTYAGRLDPMADGVVLILAGESRFEKDTLLALSKTYEVDVLLGIATDTQDPLGRIIDTSRREVDPSAIEQVVLKMTSITSLLYPMYSSVPVEGKPLFVHARAGTAVEVPQKKVTIYEATLLGINKVSSATLATEAIRDIEKVIGDFRQAESIADWQTIEKENGEVWVLTLHIHASSGTYMRSLAAWIGEQLGVPALAYRITRTKLGEYEIGK